MMSEKKNASEIILHPARSSRLLISRSCREKCFDVLKQLKGGKQRRGGEEEMGEEEKAENRGQSGDLQKFKEMFNVLKYN